MTILGFTPVHSKPPSSEWGSGGIRSGPRLDWLQGVEEKSNSESRCFESDFLERKFYLPLSGVRKFTLSTFSREAWQLAYLKAQMAIHWFFFVVAQSWAGTCVSSPRAPSWPGRMKKRAHPVFPLQTRHPTLPLPGRPQRSLAKLWNAIKDVEWVGTAPPKTRSAWTGAVAKEMYLQARCQDYITAVSYWCFSDMTTICIISRFFVKSSFVLKRTSTTLFFSQTGWFWWTRELSWLRPAPTSCLCQQPLSLHSFSQGTKPSHTESTSWTAPENLKSISLNRILLGDVSVTRRK